MNRATQLSLLIALGMAWTGCEADTPAETQPTAAAAPEPTAPEPTAPEPTAPEPASTDLQDSYRSQAEALVVAIEAGKSSEEVLQLADALTSTGLKLLEGMTRAHPECKTYLDAIAAVGPTLKDLPLEEIESGYHADGKLPPMPSGACYHGKDLVVHPATVAALAKGGLDTDEQRDAAQSEIAEVLSHLTAVEPSITE
jgi:hypothetical protein